MHSIAIRDELTDEAGANDNGSLMTHQCLG